MLYDYRPIQNLFKECWLSCYNPCALTMHANIGPHVVSVTSDTLSAALNLVFRENVPNGHLAGQ